MGINMRIEHLRVNHLENPIGYDFSYLTLSWRVEEAIAKFSDEVQVIISETDDMRNPVYDSGIMHDFRQCMLEVQISLKPRMRYFWKVSVGTQFGEKAESRTEWFETAKMEEKWTAWRERRSLVQCLWRPGEGIRFPWSWITGGCEPLDMGAGN